jgi:transposase
MMRRQEATQSPMFSKSITLSDRIPERHLLRRVKASIDFDFVYHEVEQLYGAVGHPSVPPPIILKLMVVLVLYNVRSERELMATLPLRLDWLWFLGYDLESETPNHSVLSKARARWGAKLFETFFQRVLEQCIQAGLIDGRQVFVDSSLIDANASIDSLFDKKKATAELRRRLDEQGPTPEGDASAEQSEVESKPADEVKPKPAEDQDKGKTARYRSSTDPDATGAKHRGDKMRPRYATHRMIDASSTVITATAIGPGHQNEAELLVPLIEQHEKRTEAKVETLTADGKYGVLGNLVACEERSIITYVVPFRDNHTTRGGMFAECDFRYDPQSDTYRCPAEQQLKRAAYRPDRDAYKYTAPRQACRVCLLRSHCTTAKRAPRSILRHVKQELIDRCRKQARSDKGRAALKSRMSRMEGSFAQSTRLGYKKARWRGLNRMRIQDLLIATMQNCLILLRSLAPLPEKTAKRISFTFVRLRKLLMNMLTPSSITPTVPTFA